MLPVSYYERISSAYGLRTNEYPRERRRAIRADFRWPATVHALRGRFIGPEVGVKLREMSRGGCSFVTGKGMMLGDMFLMRFTMREQGTYWFWCKVRRVIEKDRLTTVIGCEFIRALYPGQKMGPEVDVGNVLWMKVDGDSEPEDPLAPVGGAEVN